MRIGYLTSVYARAGDTFIRGEVRELRRRGHEVFTWSIRGPLREEAVDEEIRAEQKTTEFILARSWARLAGIFLLSWLQRPAAMGAAAGLAWRCGAPGFRARLLRAAYLVEAAWLARDLEQREVEHLHDHIGANSATVAMLAARITGIPWSFTLHGPEEFFAPERIGLAQKIEAAAFTVCVSSFGRSQCMLWTRPDLWPRLEVVRCGLDAAFLEARPAPPPEAPRLVCVGRLAEQKGQLVLLAAIARLREQGVACELSLVGDGPLRPLLERAIEEHGLGDAVELVGWRGKDAVSAAIREARCLVLPSFAEGLPVALMEALALGRPVVSTYVAGIPELVEPGVNGWLVPAGSVEALTVALREALEAPSERLAQMGRAGAERVRKDHRREFQVEALEVLIGSAARGRDRA